MLQRIQTIFLILAAASMVVAIFFPVWQGVDSGIVYKLFPLHFSSTDEAGMHTVYFPYSITAILMLAAATIAIMEVRRFDNRILQIKMGTLNSLIMMGVMISCVLFANRLTEEHPSGWTYGPALYLSFAGVTFNWLAIRFIRRDEKLVRDSERIR